MANEFSSDTVSRLVEQAMEKMLRQVGWEAELAIGGGRVDLRRFVVESPEDDAPRLVYADHLEETGDPVGVAWAEYIRLDCEATRIAEDARNADKAIPVDWWNLQKRMGENRHGVAGAISCLARGCLSFTPMTDFFHSGTGVPGWCMPTSEDTVLYVNRGMIAALVIPVRRLFYLPALRQQWVETFFALEPVQFVYITGIEPRSGNGYYWWQMSSIPEAIKEWMYVETNPEIVRHRASLGLFCRHSTEFSCRLAMSDAVLTYFREKSQLKPLVRTRKLLLEGDSRNAT